MITSSVATNIQAVSPLLMAGAAHAGSARPSASAVPRILEMVRFIALPLQCVVAGLAGTDTDDLVEVGYENLAVADLAGTGRALDGVDHLVDHGVVDGRFDLDFWQ